MALLGYLNREPWAPKFIIGPRPSEFVFDNRSTHLLGTNSFSYNIGHLLIDDILPGFIAMDLFGLSYSDSQQILLSNCSNTQTNNAIINPYTLRPAVEDCRQMINEVNLLFHDHPVMWLSNVEKPICFRNVLVGQSLAFSLYSLELARGVFLRRMRNFIRARHHLPHAKLTWHQILVPLKDLRGSHSPSIWRNLCDDVHLATEYWELNINIMCSRS